VNQGGILSPRLTVKWKCSVCKNARQRMPRLTSLTHITLNTNGFSTSLIGIALNSMFRQLL